MSELTKTEQTISQTSLLKEREPLRGKVLSTHFISRGTDGVSLQMQEINTYLKSNGWDVFECSSDCPEDGNGLRIPMMNHCLDEVVQLKKQIFTPDIADPSKVNGLMDLLEKQSRIVQDEVEKYIDREGIRIVHIRNVFSLPENLAATLAFYRIAEKRPDLIFVSQSHDLAKEPIRAHKYETPYPEFQRLLDKIINPVLPNIKNVVIHSQGGKFFEGNDCSIIPDAFDFSMERARPNNKNGFRKEMGIGENDLIVGVMTRIVERKGIEFAIQYVKKLQEQRHNLASIGHGIGLKERKFDENSRIILALVQKEDLPQNMDYYKKLLEFAKQQGVDLRYFGHHVVADSRYRGESDKYPFYSTYGSMDIICYPPYWEGFGNQLLEAVWAGYVPVLFEYPVFKSDIAKNIRNFISLGDSYEDQPSGLKAIPWPNADTAANKTIQMFRSPEIARLWAAQNLSNARSHYDINVVGKQYLGLFSGLLEKSFSKS